MAVAHICTEYVSGLRMKIQPPVEDNQIPVSGLDILPDSGTLLPQLEEDVS
jgi:hypothetical protein